MREDAAAAVQVDPPAAAPPVPPAEAAPAPAPAPPPSAPTFLELELPDEDSDDEDYDSMPDMVSQCSSDYDTDGDSDSDGESDSVESSNVKGTWDAKWGRFKPIYRITRDQVPLPFCVGQDTTWDFKGNKRVAVKTPSDSLTKRVATLDVVCAPDRPYEMQPMPGIVFRGARSQMAAPMSTVTSSLLATTTMRLREHHPMVFGLF